MKKISLLTLIISLIVAAQVPVEKTTEQLRRYVSNLQQDSEVLVWIMFTDKGPDVEGSVSFIQSIVSEKSLQRRSKVLPKTSLIDQTDLPIYSFYIDQVQSLGFKLKHKSKWFNAVSGHVHASKLNLISGLPFVKQVDLVTRLPRIYEQKEPEFHIELNDKTQRKVVNPNVYDYGNSLTQLQQINVPALHNLGYTGQGVTICVMDAGFSRLSHEVFSSMNIIAAYDFVNSDSGVGDSTDLGTGSHGTATLSVIGGFKEGKLIGPAFGANFILAKTENTFSETPVEEDNWIAALEWADSIGVDVTSTSLGYLDYDAPFIGYTWENMDGNTARITIAADLAVKKGIVVFNSAGNEGFNSTHNTLIAPADGDSVVAVGAVNSLGTRSSFSSVGNTVDGRIKPDVVAMGSSVTIAGSSSDTVYSTSSGTSFSCPLAAGVAALILSFNPNLTPMQVRDAMRNTASRNQNPDRLYGWGIIDALGAVNAIIPVELLNFTVVQSNNTVSLSWATATEINNSGFSVERARENSNFNEIGFVAGAGNSTSYKFYNYEDEIDIPGKYHYRLKQINFDGTYKYSPEEEVIISGASEFILYQNYPNPFNPSTNVKYSIPVRANIKLILYDILGNKVGQIFEGTVDAGIYEVKVSANDFSYPLSSGIYFVKLVAEGFQRSIKIVLAK
jgi:subtilisin family serine protease